MRYLQLDFFRGLMLTIMIINHLGGSLIKVSKAPFGIFSVALGFIFLSGAVIGILAVKKENKNFDEWSNSFFNRAKKIYYHHMFLFILLFLAGFIFYSNSLFFSIFESFHFDRPWGINLVLGFFLLNQPKFLGILPIYIVFVLFIPFVLKGLKKGKGLLIFCLSGGAYLISQIIDFTTYHQVINNHTYAEFGGYNLLAWQFLFFLGVILGHLFEKKKLSFLINKRLLLLASVVVFMTAVFRRATFFNYLIDNEFIKASSDFVAMNLANKGMLTIIPLLNFLVVALLFFNLVQLKIVKFRNKWMELLGQHSLDVFTFHVFLVFLGTILKEILLGVVPGFVYFGLDILISLVGVSLLFLFVHLKTAKKTWKSIFSNSLKPGISKVR